MATHHDQIQDRYTIIETLGEGAFATTYLCEDTQEARQVAIKAMHLTQLDVWKSFEMFEREARVLKSLKHAGVPDFYDVFRVEKDDEPNAFYLVQEHISGKSLQAMIDDGDRLSQPEIMQLLLGLLDILNYLHTQSPPVYHRDIKPSNIIVQPMGAPVLIDFGSVCDGWRAQNEQGSTVAGTHGYMPPEQYMGQVSASSDLYALAATILHLTTGQAPSEFPFDTGRIELPDNLPCEPSVKRFLNKALETAPNARPQSAQDARALLLTDGPTQTSTALAVHNSTLPATATSKNHPLLAVLGPPVRDINGPERDYFRAMVPAPFSTNVSPGMTRAGDDANENSAMGVLLWLFLVSCTAGFWLPIAFFIRQSRKKKYVPLFTHGQYIQGQVIGSSGGGNNNQATNTVVYSFVVNDTTYRNGVPVLGEIYFAIGDPIGILYDEKDPTKSVAIFK